MYYGQRKSALLSTQNSLSYFYVNFNTVNKKDPYKNCKFAIDVLQRKKVTNREACGTVKLPDKTYRMINHSS